MILSAFLLGLFGAFSHCAGMCSGVGLLLGRKAGAAGPQVLLLHAGRLTTYVLLGGVAGAAAQLIGQAAGAAQLHTVLFPAAAHANAHGAPAVAGAAGGSVPALSTWQAPLAIVAGAVAVYMAVAMLGRAPSPERLLGAVTRRWSRAMRAVSASRPGTGGAAGLRAYGLGLLWGLLPCGLVLSALVIATAGASPAAGATAMLAFGLGTGPLGVAVSLAGQALGRLPLRPLRHLSAAVMLLFGAQLALRGLAAWGWVEHLHLGGVMLW